MSVTNNSLSKDYLHLDDHAKQITDTPGFKPFTINSCVVLGISVLSCVYFCLLTSSVNMGFYSTIHTQKVLCGAVRSLNMRVPEFSPQSEYSFLTSISSNNNGSHSLPHCEDMRKAD